MSNIYYIVKSHKITDSEPPIFSAFSEDGGYIGTPENAYFICTQKGIKPEKSFSDTQVCSIGYNEKESLWYAWQGHSIESFTKREDAIKFAESSNK